MEQERKSLRIGLTAIACALALRLLGSGALAPVVTFLSKPEVASFLVYLETGRIVRPGQATQPQPTLPTVPLEATQPEPTQPEKTAACFAPEDAETVTIRNSSDYSVDLEAMLLSPLQWDLTSDGPAVLILHTHATESYTQTAGATYKESSDYRTLDEQYNMVGVGAHLAELLQAGGIQVLHDRTLHDYPNYTGSYGNARDTIAQYLEQYPSIRMVLDIHRDASSMDGGTQLETDASVAGKDSAQLMMVVGTNGSGLKHPNWETNMALAVKLHAQLEKLWPGICRPISFRNQRFNQDMSSGAMLIEVGAAGDTFPEALVAAEALAEGILALAWGTVTADSAS